MILRRIIRIIVHIYIYVNGESKVVMDTTGTKDNPSLFTKTRPGLAKSFGIKSWLAWEKWIKVNYVRWTFPALAFLGFWGLLHKSWVWSHFDRGFQCFGLQWRQCKSFVNAWFLSTFFVDLPTFFYSEPLNCSLNFLCVFHLSLMFPSLHSNLHFFLFTGLAECCLDPWTHDNPHFFMVKDPIVWWHPWYSPFFSWLLCFEVS